MLYSQAWYVLDDGSVMHSENIELDLCRTSYQLYEINVILSPYIEPFLSCWKGNCHEYKAQRQADHLQALYKVWDETELLSGC
jgi:hypothetical protein